MQLVPRYLVKNRINIISNTAGLVVEYRPVYQRTIRITKGVDNVIQFRMLNADQKPVILPGTPVFVAFNDNLEKVLEIPCDVLDDGSSTDTRGMFTVTITDVSLLSIPQQYLKYNIYIVDNNGRKNVTYTNTDFTSSGVIYVDGMSYPEPLPSTEITSYYEIAGSWYAGSDNLDATIVRPEIANSNGNHTVVVYPNGYEGTVTIQGTLDGSTGINWFDIETLDIAGQTVYTNFTGTYTFIRFKLDTDPATNTPKIVIRN